MAGWSSLLAATPLTVVFLGFVALFPYFCGERCVNLAVDAPLMTGPSLGIWSIFYFFSVTIAVASFTCFESSRQLAWLPFCDERHAELSVILMWISFPATIIGTIYITAKCWVPWCGYCLNAT